MRSLICILSVLVLMTNGCGFLKTQQPRNIDPMRIPIRMRVPDHIGTIGEAAQYYAETASYHLVTGYPAPEESDEIALGTINILAPTDTSKVFPIEEGILMLLHNGDRLVIDREHKLFSFEKGFLE